MTRKEAYETLHPETRAGVAQANSMNAKQERGGQLGHHVVSFAADLKDDPSRSNRQVAEGLGVDHKTVQAVRKNQEATGEIPQLDKTTGADGKERRKPIRTAFIDPTPEGKKEAEAVVKANRAEKATERREERLNNIAEISKGLSDNLSVRFRAI